MATGEIVGIINSDDLLAESGVIGKVIDCFKDHKDIDCVYADLYYVSQHDTSKIVRHWITGKQRSYSFIISTVLSWECPSTMIYSIS